ncbi:MAG: hypothetical protein JO166_02435 [Deltaproteobacteria bacterium]|nr:hypothetical protein [Deltaproteobacteria bacterium]
MANKIPLSDVLQNITEELAKADKAARERGSAVMQFTDCELDFAIEAERQGNAGVKLWVLDVGGEVKRSESNTIKLKFSSLSNNPIQAIAVTREPAPKPGKQVRRKGK